MGIPASLPRIGSATFVVTMVLVAIGLGLVINETQFRPAKQFHAEFADSSGLRPNDEVRVAGVRVGEVVDTRLTPRNTVMVTFTAESDQPVTGGTRALVRLKDVTGHHFLQLAEGAGSPEPLREGGTIPLTRTAPAIDLNVLLAGIRPLIDALNPDQVNRFASSLIAVLQGQKGTVQELLGNIGSFTNTLADRDAVIGRVIDNLNLVLGTLDERNDNLSDLITRLQQLVSGLSEDGEVIGSSLDGINELTTNTTDLLRESRPPLREDIVELGRLSELLNHNQSTLNLVLSRLPVVYPRLDRLGAHGSFFNFYLCDVNVRMSGPHGDIYSPTASSGRHRCDDK